MIDNKFSIQRTLNLFMLYINENRKFLLICAAAVTGILICFAFTTVSEYQYNKWTLVDPALTNLVVGYTFLGYIFAAIGASFMFSEMKSKQGRIRTLMLPANSSEKLLSRMLVYILAFTIFYIIAVCIAELVRTSYLIANPRIYGSPITPLYAVFWNKSALHEIVNTKYPHLVPCIVFAGIYTVQSFFVLGGTLWYKYSTIKTFALFFVLFSLYVVSLLSLASHLWIGKTYNTVDNFLSNYGLYLILLLEIVTCLFNWTMAWWRLRETDVITTKR